MPFIFKTINIFYVIGTSVFKYLGLLIIHIFAGSSSRSWNLRTCFVSAAAAPAPRIDFHYLAKISTQQIKIKPQPNLAYYLTYPTTTSRVVVSLGSSIELVRSKDLKCTSKVIQFTHANLPSGALLHLLTCRYI